VQISARLAKIVMTKQNLDGPQVGSRLQQVGREAMATIFHER
jgi:hypothetical protein